MWFPERPDNLYAVMRWVPVVVRRPPWKPYVGQNDRAASVRRAQRAHLPSRMLLASGPSMNLSGAFRGGTSASSRSSRPPL